MTWFGSKVACIGLLATLVSNSSAQDLHYSLGLAASHGVLYEGSDQAKTSVTPLIAIRYGRLRLSSSRASSLMNVGSGYDAPKGASFDLYRSEVVRMGGSLRFDNGRKASDSPYLKDTLDIAKTLRLQVYADKKLSDQVSLNASISQDILGKRGGALASLDLAYRQNLSAHTSWSSSVGVAGGNGVSMNTLFGTNAYRAHAGLKDIHFGTGLTHAFGRDWAGFASIGLRQLLGSAADSPLNRQGLSTHLSIGFAYRH